MTNEERHEFEEHKKRAEKQLSEMYYGKSANNGGGKQNLKMPPFLSKNGETAPKTNTQKGVEAPNEKQAEGTAQKPGNPKENKMNLLKLLNFDNINLDNDRITILALCLLLSAENTDELLIMALIYIML